MHGAFEVAGQKGRAESRQHLQHGHALMLVPYVPGTASEMFRNWRAPSTEREKGHPADVLVSASEMGLQSGINLHLVRIGGAEGICDLPLRLLNGLQSGLREGDAERGTIALVAQGPNEGAATSAFGRV